MIVYERLNWNGSDWWRRTSSNLLIIPQDTHNFWVFTEKTMTCLRILN